ncbi:MAG TPA: hypothetical protein VLZ12_08615 [Verrucomicrobiae bacterium]|nr:hypothetical protein [Verrucomicrobiae bacterium]
MGENATRIRAGICDGMAFLGIELDEQRNAANAPVISRDGGRVSVRIIHTDEELMIARTGLRCLGQKGGASRNRLCRTMNCAR